MLTMATTAMADSMVDTGPTDMDTPVTDTDTTARGPLMPSPRLMLMLSTDTTDTPAPTPMDTAARGLLRPSPRLMLSTDTTDMVPAPMVLATATAMLVILMPTMATTTARGPLRPRLSPRFS